jgi:hypothetical protein
MDWPLDLRRSGCGASILTRPNASTNGCLITTVLPDFVVSKVTPTIHTKLGYKMFLMFASLNIGAMAPFALLSGLFAFTNVHLYRFDSLIPETKGRSLEEMDIIFGAISPDDRAANLSRQRQEQGAHLLLPMVCSANEKVVSELQRSRAEVSMPS